MAITAAASNSKLLDTADYAYPSSGTPAQLLILSGDTFTGPIAATNAADELTTTGNHNLVTGARVRTSTTATLPAPLTAGVDYFVIVTGATTFKLAATLADAQASTAIDLTTDGTGTITATEQVPNYNDPIAVLVSKELPSGGPYARIPMDSLGAATITNAGKAAKPTKTVQLNNTGSTSITYRHYLVAFGASSTIGDASGITGFFLGSETANQTIPAGQARVISVTLEASRA
jgi:hypothetical protein